MTTLTPAELLPLLGPDQRLVIAEMATFRDDAIPYLRELARDLGLPVERLRQVLRSLDALGLVTYGPLFNPDGGMSGSSWWLTEKGAAVQAMLEETRP